MAVNYASKYSQNVDERFSTGSLTNGIVNGEFDWIGVSTVNVYSIPTSAMNDYSVSGTNRYGTPEELGNETQEMTLKQDRSFTFTIDRKNYDDTMMVMEAGKALRRQIDEVVIPEVDTYRISTLVAGAPVANVKTLATTKENAYEEFWQCRAFWMIMKLHSLDEWYCAHLHTTIRSSWMSRSPKKVIWLHKLQLPAL